MRTKLKSRRSRLMLVLSMLLVPAAQAAVYQEIDGQVIIEAENFDSRTTDANNHHWHIVPDEDGTDFLGDAGSPVFANPRGSYVQVLPNGAGGGGPGVDPMLDFKVAIDTPGTYQFYARWASEGGSDDSFYVLMPNLQDGVGGTVADWYRFSDGPDGLDFAARSWRGQGGFEREDAGGGDVPATWEIPSSGVYTLRITQREDGAAIDAVMLQLASLPAPAEPGPSESPIAGDYPPFISSRSPGPDAQGVKPDGTVQVVLADGATVAVDPGSISLSLNGTPLTIETDKVDAKTTVTSSFPDLLASGSVHTLSLEFNGTTETWQFTVEEFLTLTAADGYSMDQVDTSLPGFRIWTHQGPETPEFPNSEERAEKQLAGVFIDPNTGQPVFNETWTGANPDGSDSALLVNFERETFDAGNFSASSTPSRPDAVYPGVLGFHFNNIAMEARTVVELTPGVYEMGVNSDDGFVVRAGREPRDLFAPVAGRFDGGRGAADTTFTIQVEEAAAYPFRLLYYQGGGGASVEWFMINRETDEKVLLNDTDHPDGLATYQLLLESAEKPPFVSMVNPFPDASGVGVDQPLTVTVQNQDLTVDTSSIQLQVNGDPVTPSTTTEGSVTTISYVPESGWAAAAEQNVTLSFSDTGSPAGTTEASFAFTTERAPIDLPPLRQDANGLVVIEAENFDANTPQGAHRWDFQSATFGQFAADLAAGYSGEGAMYALPESNVNLSSYPDFLTSSPRLDFEVEFNRAGTHYIWHRSSDGGGDSLHVGLNEDVTDTGIRIDSGCCGNSSDAGTDWVWVSDLNSSVVDVNGVDSSRARFEVPSPGVHTVSVWMREDGLVLDKLVITSDPLFSPQGMGPEENRRVGDPTRPAVSLTAPANDAALPAGQTISLEAEASDEDGNVVLVEFFVGDTKVGEDDTAPYQATFDPDDERAYRFSARATDDSGDTSVSSQIRVVVGNPPRALFVLDLGPNASDSAIQERLEQKHNFLVTTVDDGDSATTDAAGVSLIVISSTVSSGEVGDKFTQSDVPIIQWEEALLDNLLMTGDSGSSPDHHGTTGSQTTIEIVNADHPLAGGLDAGPHTVTTSPQTVSWGNPDTNRDNAAVVAHVQGDSDQVVIFGYDQGDPLFDSTPAPERRIMLFINNDSATALTPVGWHLFDAAVHWALRLPVPTPPDSGGDEVELTISRDAGTGVITLSWEGTGTLQSANQVDGPWNDAANQDNPQTITPTETHQFYQVVIQ